MPNGKKFLSGILFLISFSGLFATDYHLYFLGGQSNMDGFGYIKYLPDSLNRTFDGTWIFHGNPSKDDSTTDGRGIWASLRPGHGVLFSSDGKTNKYSSRFGCELSFADRLSELRPAEKIAIVKYSRLGASIDTAAAGKYGCWEPQYNGINQFDHFVATVKQALAVKDLDGDGTEDRLIPAGIIWMQGEGDACVSEEIAKRYYQNLQNLVAEIRKVFEAPEMPVVIGLISDSGIAKGASTWRYGEIVQQAQRLFSEEDTRAALLENTLNYSYLDKWHYNSAAFVDMGIGFAELVHQLREK